MHDTYLLVKISQALKKLCEENNIKRVDRFTLAVNYNSHIDVESLRQHLETYNKNIVGHNLQVKIQREDIADQIAIIYSLQGETNGV